jgi:uncharacterized membrane protein YhaH (DUF805 family)
MSFVDAIKTVLSKYVTFSGRARRSEYWFWLLAIVIANFVASFIDRGLGTEPGKVGIISGLLVLATFLPNLAVTVRRLHDTSRTGWWVLIGLVPIVGVIVLIVFAAQDSHGDNAYGPSPKAVGQDGAPVLQ